MTQQIVPFTTHTTWTAPSDLVYGSLTVTCAGQQGAIWSGSPNSSGWTGEFTHGIWPNPNVVPGTTVLTIQAGASDFPGTPGSGFNGPGGCGCGVQVGGSSLISAAGGAGGNAGGTKGFAGGGSSFWGASLVGVTFTPSKLGIIGTPSLATQQVTLVYNTSDPYLAPTNQQPANNGYLDAAAGFVMQWSALPGTDSGTVAQIAIRRQDITTSGAFQWFNPSTHTWGGTELYFSAPGATSYTFAAADWVNGDNYSWSVSVAESFNLKKSPYSAAWVLLARALPTLVITAPSGTINTPTPTVSWTPSFHAGTSMTAYRGLIYRAADVAQPGFFPGQLPVLYDTGNVASTTATSFNVPTSILNNSQSYSVFVQINGGGPLSAWTRSDFTVSFTPPPTPTFVWNSITDPFGSPMWVASGQVQSPTGASAFAGEVNVSSDGGVTWDELRSQGGQTPPYQPLNTTITDYESPFNIPLLYRARVWGVRFGQNIPSLWTSNVALTLPTNNYFLVDPITPGPDANGSLGVCQLRRVTPQTGATPFGRPSLSEGQVEAQGAFYGIGRTDVVVVSGDLYETEFDVSAIFLTDADFQTFKALRARQVPLELKTDLGTGDTSYVMLGAAIPVTTLRAANRRQNPMRVISFHCYPVLAP
jgi:hypothetical protein